ncbi:MAG: hypothetical protein ACI9KE_005767 [Polyangiales bacterium]|jgi:hypothetical protein
MYCQSCGAENTEGARFCNMCGTSLAKAGETGGLLTKPDMAPQMAESTVPDSTPGPGASGQRHEPGRTIVGGADASGTQSRGYRADLSGASMSGVSLAGIGVKSSKKTWSMILLGALTLLGAGALASWLAMGGSAATDGHAEPDDPFVIGSPLPSDGDVDSITGMAGVATSADGMEAPMGTAMGPSASMSGSMTTPSMSGSTTPSMTTASMTQTNRPSMTTSNTSPSNTQMTTAMTSTTATMTPTPSDMSDTPTMTSTMSTSMSGDLEVPEERDIEMELYSTRVRFLIRRYYASRAQSCFDRATRNNPSVSGTVVIAMTIGAEGNVSGTRVARNTTGNEPLGNCLSAQVSSWRLSAPPGGSLQMQIPFSR